MRNTLPAMVYVQTTVPSVAGHIGVGVEGSNATVQGDDKYHPNTVGTLSVPPMDPYGPVTRYFEVFSRGTNSCVWNAEPAQPFVKLSQYNGTVGPNGGPDTRVFISIDWANAPPAPNTTTVNINVTTPCRGLDKYGFPGQMVIVPVTNRKVPSNFTKGYVESDGHVAIEGIHYSAIVPPATSSPDNAGVTYHTYKNYGRISGGVGLWPLNTEKLTVETAPALEYNMYLFTNTTAANVTLHISPAHNYLSDYNPLEYAISLFPTGSAPTEPPTLVRPVGATVGANMPAAWGHAVADSVWGLTSGNQTTTRHNVPREGAYTLRIQALLSGIIVQKVVVDLGGVRPSYFGPPESFYIDAENPAIANTIGVYNGTSFHNTRGALGGVGDGNATRIEKSAAVGTRSWMSLGLFVAFAAAALNML